MLDVIRIAFMNRKGGVGKSSLVAGLAGVFASQGLRVAVLDLDPQGEQAGMLGVEDGDDGEALLACMLGDSPVVPTRTHRPGLDIVRGGYHLRRFSSAGIQANQHFSSLHRQLDYLAPLYDLLLIDSSPGEEALQQAVAGVGPMVVVPIDAGPASVRSLGALATVIRDANSLGIPTTLSAIILNNIQPSKTALAKQRLQHVSDLTANIATCKVLPRWIRSGQDVIANMHEHNMLPHEVAARIDSAEARRLTSDYTLVANQLHKHIQEEPTHG